MMTTLPPAINERGQYPVSEAARLLGVDRTTINRWCKAGILSYRLQRGTMRKIIAGKQLLLMWNSKA